jgi:drug/metabolite transporter (DMT)-like permease
MGPERAEVIVLYLPLMALPISIPFAFSGWVMPLAGDWALLLGIGLTTQVAQTYMTRGLQLEKTARATPVGYLQIVFAMIWGALILREPLTIWTAIGATIIVGSTLGIALLRHITGAPDE